MTRSVEDVAPAASPKALAVAPEAIAPSEATGVDAARLRGRYPISLPDAHCLATAKQTARRSSPSTSGC
jgi:hypothetical protein